MQFNLSFIIVNYFTNQLTNKLIHSIAENGKDIYPEIIIVDNTTDEKSSFRSAMNTVKIYHTGKNLGYGRACNIGAKMASSDNLIFINPDTLFVDSRSIQQINESFNRFSPTTIFGGRILGQNDKPVCSTFKFSSFIHIYFQNSLRRTVGISPPLLTNLDNSYLQDENSEVDWISGAMLCVNKDFFLKLGGFNEDIFMYEEDADLCYRARKINGKVIFNPSIRIIHLGGAASKKNNELLSLIGLKSSLNFYEQRKSYVKAQLLKKIILTTWNIFYAQLVLLALVAPVRFLRQKRYWKKLITYAKKYDKTSIDEIVHCL